MSTEPQTPTQEPKPVEHSLAAAIVDLLANDLLRRIVARHRAGRAA